MGRLDRTWRAALRSKPVRATVELLVFTAGAVLVVGVSVLLLAATLRITGWVTDSITVRSVLSIAVFTTSVAVSTYLLVQRER